MAIRAIGDQSMRRVFKSGRCALVRKTSSFDEWPLNPSGPGAKWQLRHPMIVTVVATSRQGQWGLPFRIAVFFPGFNRDNKGIWNRVISKPGWKWYQLMSVQRN